MTSELTPEDQAIGNHMESFYRFFRERYHSQEDSSLLAAAAAKISLARENGLMINQIKIENLRLEPGMTIVEGHYAGRVVREVAVKDVHGSSKVQVTFLDGGQANFSNVHSNTVRSYRGIPVLDMGAIQKTG